jgi:hypothetical protein
MLCRTNVLHLQPQLDHFTYLTQFVRLCVLYIIFCITYYGISYITLYVSSYNNCSPKIKCVISSLFIWSAFISSYLFIGSIAIFRTILVDPFSDLILFGDDTDISPGDSVTIQNVNRKLTNSAVIPDLFSGVARKYTRLCQGSLAGYCTGGVATMFSAMVTK